MVFIKKIPRIIAIILSMVFLLTGCYKLESENLAEYSEFRNKMQKTETYIYNFLPDNKTVSTFDDLYLFYNSRDLIDNYHTIYLNCTFSKENFQLEKERISALFSDLEYRIENSESFDCESLMYENTLIYDSTESGLFEYEYVLFFEDELKIVYVTFFDKKIHGNSTNIPQEYLPKELVTLQNSRTEGNMFDSIISFYSSIFTFIFPE